MDVKRILESIRELDRRASKEKGKEEEERERLKREFGVTPEKVPALIKKIKSQLKKANKALHSEIRKFREIWKENMPDEDCPI